VHRNRCKPAGQWGEPFNDNRPSGSIRHRSLPRFLPADLKDRRTFAVLAGHRCRLQSGLFKRKGLARGIDAVMQRPRWILVDRRQEGVRVAIEKTRYSFFELCRGLFKSAPMLRAFLVFAALSAPAGFLAESHLSWSVYLFPCLLLD
jgi:hypothetical protein